MPSAFQQKLAFGQAAESSIAKWLRGRGHFVLPVYDLEYDTGKGPRLFTPSGQLIAPDLLCIKDGKTIWVEAKHKTVFSWFRKTSRWVTGIDLRHYEDYCNVADQTDVPIWLIFLHRASIPSGEDLRYGCPAECPTGLYGQDLKICRRNESHRSNRHGRSGMVYWWEGSLHKLGTLQQIPLD